jgi:hypothetical protein
MDARLRDARIRGDRDAVAPLVGSIGGEVSFGDESSDWVNNCAAHYYGFLTVMPRRP